MCARPRVSLRCSVLCARYSADRCLGDFYGHLQPAPPARAHYLTFFFYITIAHNNKQLDPRCSDNYRNKKKHRANHTIARFVL